MKDANIAISDSLKVEQNEDGSFTLEWDKEDPTWSFLNGLTSKEITAIIEKAITMDENEPLSEGWKSNQGSYDQASVRSS